MRRRGGTRADLDRAVAALGIDERVVGAFHQLDRARFVPAGSEARAYIDSPVGIPEGQTTSQPTLIASMVDALQLPLEACVLEVGTGYGFQTALLALLARDVISIERHEPLADAARRNLRGFENVEVRHGDGALGAPDRAPFDGIVVSAAAAELPEELVSQLRAGGRLVIPVARRGSDDVLVYVKDGDILREERLLTPARFVPLVRDED